MVAQVCIFGGMPAKLGLVGTHFDAVSGRKSRNYWLRCSVGFVEKEATGAAGKIGFGTVIIHRLHPPIISRIVFEIGVY